MQGIGVLISAVVIYLWPHMTIFDPICTVIFAIIVFFTTVPVSKECLFVLLERAPLSVNVSQLRREAQLIEGVTAIKEIRVWSLNEGKTLLTMKAVRANGNNPHLLKNLNAICKSHGVFHSTIELAFEDQLC